jgi:ubiquitin C-terminal hydrolase
MKKTKSLLEIHEHVKTAAAGLKNNGGACFANSIIQILYSTPLLINDG